MHQYGSILLVDDDPIQIAILTAYFSSLNVHTISSANNSAVALQKIGENTASFDLIVTDLQMPEMDGLEFLRHLSELDFRGKLAIISGVTGNLLDHAARLAEMHKLNLIAKLGKPLSKQSLDEAFVSGVIENDSTNVSGSEGFSDEEFRNALSQGLIIPHYQPKINLASKNVAGAEALARWIKPDGERVSPVMFIEYATNNGLLEELTFKLFEQTLLDLKGFMQVDPDIKVAINLAPEMIANIKLPDQLATRLRQQGISAKNISFEVTESSMLNLSPVTLEVLSRLRIQDFEIAVDDFGTGSSNIQNLRDFPYSELKIDRSFIHDVTTNEFSRQTVHAAIALARQQNMIIVAEGIEDQETWDFLSGLGIDQAQGYLMARPMPADAYISFLKENGDGLRDQVA